MGIKLAAFVWGFSEATFFFIVPDVLLSAIALWRPRLALAASIYALAGALAGGTLMYAWGTTDSVAAKATLDRVPAIGSEMQARVAMELRERGYLAALLGPLSGTPYKVYAVAAGAAGMGFAGFMLISIPARLTRFVAVIFLVAGIARMLPTAFSRRFRYGLLAGFWLIFYGFYFSVMTV